MAYAIYDQFTMVQEFNETLTEVLEAAHKIHGGAQKERRQFTTIFHPLILSLIRGIEPFDSNNSDINLDTTWPCNYNNHLLNYRPRNFVNDILFTSFMRLDSARIPIIYPRLSTRTLINRVPVTTAINKLIGCNIDAHNVLLFRDLLKRVNRSDLYDVCCQESQDSDFLLNLKNLILFSPSGLLDSNVFKWYSETKTSVTLTLKEKEYLTRGDCRGYVTDCDMIRHLSGAILQKLLYSSRESEVSPRIKAWYPIRGRNIIDDYFRTAEGSYRLMLFGDISSFSGSFCGGWALLVLVCLKLSQDSPLNCLKTPFLACFQKGFLLCNLIDIIKVYLFLTVGAPCYDSLREEIFYHVGGYLGVNANMSLNCVSFASLMNVFTASCPFESYIFGRIGGDDFFVVSEATDFETCYESLLWIKQQIGLYVGHLKDPIIVDPLHYINELLPVTFCKKRILVCVENETLHLTSRQKIPIMEPLIHKLSLSFRSQVELLWYSGKDQDNRTSQGMLMRRILIQLFCGLEKNRVIWFEENHRSMGLPLIDYQGLSLTHKALNQVLRVHNITLGRSYFETFSDRLQLLLFKRKLIRRCDCILSRSESRTITTTKIRFAIPSRDLLPPELLLPLIELFLSFRSLF